MIEAALFVRSEQMAHGRDEDVLGIRGVDGDAVDGLRVFKAQVLPVLAAVRGAPDAVADRGTLAVIRFARADVNYVRVRRRNAYSSDRFIWHVVKLGFPVIAAVGRFPDAAGGETDVHDHRIFF